MCDKACYATASEARGFIRRFQSAPGKRSKVRGKALYYYHCKICGFWHLSSMARKRAKLIGRAMKRRKWIDTGE